MTFSLSIISSNTLIIDNFYTVFDSLKCFDTIERPS